MTVMGGTTPACAACKYQRRRCTPNCPLAPYFPANQPKMFQSVHRLFGVSNVTKTLKSLRTKVQKEDAVKSIIYEAEMRKRFPVYGCAKIISWLQFQLQSALEEQMYVYAQLEAYKEQPSNKPVDLSPQCWPSTSSQMESSAYSSTDHIGSLAFNPELPANQFLMNECGFYSDSGDNIAKQFFELDSSLETSNSAAIRQAVEAQMDAFGMQQEREMFFQNCEDVPFNSAADRQSCIETEVMCQSSPESTLKDTTTQLMGLNISSKSELRSAAADFTLTSSVK